MNIRAAEEAVKACFILARRYQPSTEFDDYDAVFQKHDVKHNYLMSLVALQATYVERMMPLVAISENLISIAAQVSERAHESYGNVGLGDAGAGRN